MLNTGSVHVGRRGVTVHYIVGECIDLALKTDTKAIVMYRGKSGTFIGLTHQWDRTFMGMNYEDTVLRELSEQLTKDLVAESVDNQKLSRHKIIAGSQVATLTNGSIAICNSISKPEQ